MWSAECWSTNAWSVGSWLFDQIAPAVWLPAQFLRVVMAMESCSVQSAPGGLAVRA